MDFVQYSYWEGGLTGLRQPEAIVSSWLIRIQCIAFVVLYAVWILPEMVGFRNTALVMGAVAGLPVIYFYRRLLMQRHALPIWLMLALFSWAIIHLLFLSQDFTTQMLEFKRIWKYAAIGAIFALGLGLSLGGDNVKLNTQQIGAGTETSLSSECWILFYFGLSLPVLIYLIKYAMAVVALGWGLNLPAYLGIYHGSQPFYIPKTDYVAFCLPPLAIALGRLKEMFQAGEPKSWSQWSIGIWSYGGLIVATLFLFLAQNIKNGMAYAVICIFIFILLLTFQRPKVGGSKWSYIVIVALLLTAFVSFGHIQKNESWRTLVADARVALQTEQYQHWKFAGIHGYPNNELGKMVSITNYERVAWLKAGAELSFGMPMGYGLIEDSFMRMARAKWPEVSPNLSHSHSGWLDVALAIGWPGLTLILTSLFYLMIHSASVVNPWSQVAFWAPLSILLLWCTTEVAATVPFAALIFWICLCGGLIVRASLRNVDHCS